jgi:hypothetical protein
VLGAEHTFIWLHLASSSFIDLCKSVNERQLEMFASDHSPIMTVSLCDSFTNCSDTNYCTGRIVEPQHMSVADSASVFRVCRYHHSVADTPDKMDPEELARCAAVLAVMAYTVADMEQPLFVPR